MSMHGQEHRFEGVPLVHLLDLAGAPTGPALRGEALSTIVLITARDGYQVVLSLGEADPALSGRTIVVADAKDGAPLSGEEGPYWLIVVGDRRAARSARMIERIEIRTVE